MVNISCVSHDLCFLNPFWELVMMIGLLQSRCAVTLGLMTRSRDFQQMHINDVGPYFLAWPRYGFLNTGYTIACFYIAGISLVCNDLWHSCMRAILLVRIEYDREYHLRHLPSGGLGFIELCNDIYTSTDLCNV